MSAQPLFIGGTSSNAGKSWVATAICASLRRKGIRVAPFKAQTMSNHSYPCADGGEIGRAQVAQAEACGLMPESAMNPILLKPNTDGTSQVIVRGRVWKTLRARGYYRETSVLRQRVLEAYHSLASRFDVVVIEGAGSVSELNLRAHDVVNLELVKALEAPWVLVADIERGGVFASVAGTLALCDADERRLFRGVMVNKFRGDRSLFDEGQLLLQERCGARCLGVWPYADGLALDAEDSLATSTTRLGEVPAGASIAIVQLPSLSNGTDFSRLSWADWVTAAVARQYDFVILPGTKDTMGALAWLRVQGLDEWVRAQHRRGATIIGICGGFQILGERVRDPDGVESSGGEAAGLGLLPVETTLAPDKVTRVRRAVTPRGAEFDAYEIHLGVTTSREPTLPFARFDDGSVDGARYGRVYGTYLHGALESPAVCQELFGVTLPSAPSKAATYSALADWFESSLEQPADWLPVVGS
ncbi:MAG: cobyric acid synthase [Acidobacteriota bacterium]